MGGVDRKDGNRCVSIDVVDASNILRPDGGDDDDDDDNDENNDDDGDGGGHGDYCRGNCLKCEGP